MVLLEPPVVYLIKFINLIGLLSVVLNAFKQITHSCDIPRIKLVETSLAAVNKDIVACCID